MRKITIWISVTLAAVALVIAYELNAFGSGSGGGGHHDGPTAPSGSMTPGHHPGAPASTMPPGHH
jgi:hypothetical protein